MMGSESSCTKPTKQLAMHDVTVVSMRVSHGNWGSLPNMEIWYVNSASKHVMRSAKR